MTARRVAIAVAALAVVLVAVSILLFVAFGTGSDVPGGTTIDRP